MVLVDSKTPAHLKMDYFFVYLIASLRMIYPAVRNVLLCLKETDFIEDNDGIGFATY